MNWICLEFSILEVDSLVCQNNTLWIVYTECVALPLQEHVLTYDVHQRLAVTEAAGGNTIGEVDAIGRCIGLGHGWGR